MKEVTIINDTDKNNLKKFKVSKAYNQFFKIVFNDSEVNTHINNWYFYCKDVEARNVFISKIYMNCENLWELSGGNDNPYGQAYLQDPVSL